MKLSEFITDVLKDIDSGLAEAKKQTGRSYQVEVSTNKGVKFDIAVTAENSSSTSVEGQAKAGFIQVLGAGVGAKLEEKKDNSEVSRIEFIVYVPTQTDKEEQEDLAKFQADYEQRKIDAQSAVGLDPYR